MVHEILPVGMLQCNCSIFGDEQSGDALVIDPGDNLAEIERIVARHGLHVKAIVITHAHIDHIGGAEKLRAHTGAPVYMHEADKMLSDHLDVQASWLGIETPITFSGPRASTAITAVSAESMPPLSPTTTLRKPHLRT